MAGADPRAEGFFWLAAKAGYGIQTAPALAGTGAALVLCDPIPAGIPAQGVTAEDLSPTRLVP